MKKITLMIFYIINLFNVSTQASFLKKIGQLNKDIIQQLEAKKAKQEAAKKTKEKDKKAAEEAEKAEAAKKAEAEEKKAAQLAKAEKEAAEKAKQDDAKKAAEEAAEEKKQKQDALIVAEFEPVLEDGNLKKFKELINEYGLNPPFKAEEYDRRGISTSKTMPTTLLLKTLNSSPEHYSKRKAMIEYLVNQGVDVDEGGAIDYAIRRYNLDRDSGSKIPIFLLQDFLKKNGIQNINKKGYLVIAASVGSYDVVKFLVSEGADVNVVFTEKSSLLQGLTPLLAAADMDTKYITEAAGDMAQKYLGSKNFAPTYNVTRKAPKLSNRGHVILGQSFAENRIKIMKYLLEHGANVNATDTNGNTALMELANLTTVSSMMDEYYMKAMQVLVKKGADIYKKNNKGETVFDILQKGILKDPTHFAQRHQYIKNLLKKK